MSVEHRKFYVAKGRSLAAVEELNERWKAINQARKDFAKLFGADGCFMRGTRMVGLTYPPIPNEPKTLPPGWVWASKWHTGEYSVATPNARTKLGKELSRKMRNELAQVSVADVFPCSRLIGTSDGVRLFCPSVEKVGDAFVIGVPDGGEDTISSSTGDAKLPYAPEDAIPLKLSEYFKMKEDAGERVTA